MPGEGIVLDVQWGIRSIHKLIEVLDQYSLYQVQIQRHSYGSCVYVCACQAALSLEGIVGLLQQLAHVHRLQFKEVTEEKIGTQLTHSMVLPVLIAVPQVAQQERQQDPNESYVVKYIPKFPQQLHGESLLNL